LTQMLDCSLTERRGIRKVKLTLTPLLARNRSLHALQLRAFLLLPDGLSPKSKKGQMPTNEGDLDIGSRER